MSNSKNHNMKKENEKLKKTLQDLINELKDGHTKSERYGDCETCQETWPCERVHMANQAEKQMQTLDQK